jgi:hypothetical protein
VERVILERPWSEYNFGESFNQRGGTIMPVNTALMFPGMEGSDAFDFFTAPPSGTVPAYFFGGILSVRTEAAAYGLWVYDPNSSVHKPGLEDAFADGVTIRGSVSFLVAIAGRSDH